MARSNRFCNPRLKAEATFERLARERALEACAKAAAHWDVTAEAVVAQVVKTHGVRAIDVASPAEAREFAYRAAFDVAVRRKPSEPCPQHR
jgi:NADPH-dependent curcumin reductase CurA